MADAELPVWWEDLTANEDMPASVSVLEVETIPCTTDQWNFPHDRSTPWASDGKCSICGAEVEMISLGPDHPHLYTNLATPHTRQRAWLRINSDDLGDLIQYRREW